MSSLLSSFHYSIGPLGMDKPLEPSTWPLTLVSAVTVLKRLYVDINFKYDTEELRWGPLFRLLDCRTFIVLIIQMDFMVVWLFLFRLFSRQICWFSCRISLITPKTTIIPLPPTPSPVAIMHWCYVRGLFRAKGTCLVSAAVSLSPLVHH